MGLHCTLEFNYREIRSLRHINFLGERIAIQGDVVVRPGMAIAQITFLFWLAYVGDAGLTLWRHNGPDDRRRALMVGGSTVLFIVLGAGHTILALNGVIESPLRSTLMSAQSSGTAPTSWPSWASSRLCISQSLRNSSR